MPRQARSKSQPPMLRLLAMGVLGTPLIWAASRLTGGVGVNIGILFGNWLPPESLVARQVLTRSVEIIAASDAARLFYDADAALHERWPALWEALGTLPAWVLPWLAGLLLLVILSTLRRRRVIREARVPAEYVTRLSPVPAERFSFAVYRESVPSDSARGAILAGWVTIALFFGGFGTWAATAPLNGAVIGEAVIKVEGNRKSIQHLEGGIVSELKVQEGDRVEIGDTLIVLDDAATRAEVESLTQQQILLQATRARLEAEFDDAGSVRFPSEFDARTDAQQAMEGQRKEFESRRAAMLSKEILLKQKSAQLDEQIVGQSARKQALEKQLASVTAELETLSDLLAKGLIAKPRVLQLDRTATQLEGDIKEAESAVAAAREALKEAAEERVQLRKERRAEVSAALQEVQSKLSDVEPRLRKAEAALERNVIRSPYAGRVVDLAVFSLGGVVRSGERIMDIVPDDTSLVVEARVRVEDIADVKPGMKSEVHFTSYKQRLTPLIHGRVTEVSADRLTDERSGLAYYNVLVEVDEKELSASPEIQLYPGMAATVMIVTEQRTALDYLVGPLAASLDTSFRQK